MVHRDVKPGNLLMSSDGFVKIGDFGLAVSLDKAQDHVQGTQRYIAPERLENESGAFVGGECGRMGRGVASMPC